MNGQSLRIREIDLDIFLFDAGELTVKFVTVRELFDVEFGSKGLQICTTGEETVVVIATIVSIEVVEKTKERVKGCGRVVGNE